MTTVGELKAWLKDKPDDLRVDLLVENEIYQYQVPMNDVALVQRQGVQNNYVVLMHEIVERRANPT